MKKSVARFVGSPLEISIEKLFFRDDYFQTAKDLQWSILNAIKRARIESLPRLEATNAPFRTIDLSSIRTFSALILQRFAFSILFL